MTSQFPEHAQACYFLHTGSGVQGRPSMGAWASYGLGSESANLPAFVVLNGGSIPLGGLSSLAVQRHAPAGLVGDDARILGPLVARTLRASHETTALLEQLDQASNGRPP